MPPGPEGASGHRRRSADFPICRFAGFQTGGPTALLRWGAAALATIRRRPRRSRAARVTGLLGSWRRRRAPTAECPTQFARRQAGNAADPRTKESAATKAGQSLPVAIRSPASQDCRHDEDYPSGMAGSIARSQLPSRAICAVGGCLIAADGTRLSGARLSAAPVCEPPASPGGGPRDPVG